MKTRLCGAAIFLMLAGAVISPAQLSITYVRHGESGSNVKGEFERSGLSTNEWPAYVGNENAFSPKGEAQVLALATSLQNHAFDFIAVSPKWRTRHTILPYLKATGQTAEIWPELGETANFDQTVQRAGGSVSPDLFAGKRSIRLAPEEQAFIQFRRDGTGARELMVTNLAEAVACANRVESMLRARFGANATRVLLVGHGNASDTLIRSLTRHPEFHEEHLDNTHLWIAQEESAGHFKLERYNELP